MLFFVVDACRLRLYSNGLGPDREHVAVVEENKTPILTDVWVTLTLHGLFLSTEML
jgi:hypothetical protein